MPVKALRHYNPASFNSEIGTFFEISNRHTQTTEVEQLTASIRSFFVALVSHFRRVFTHDTRTRSLNEHLVEYLAGVAQIVL